MHTAQTVVGPFLEQRGCFKTLTVPVNVAMPPIEDANAMAKTTCETKSMSGAHYVCLEKGKQNEPPRTGFGHVF
jgi:hypothetical protein